MNRARRDLVCLMYHELRLPGRALCQSEEGYARYVVALDDFKAQVSSLKARGFHGLSVGQALDGLESIGPCVAITFDDGCETDLIAAAPLLKEAGLNATFYVVVGWLGTPGYLSHVQLQELRNLGFEIGCHSMTHSYLTDVNSDRLRIEVVGARDTLQQLLGHKVEHFSCPGGRWNSQIASLAESAGYRSFATSVIGTNSGDKDRFRLKRVVVLRDTNMATFERLCLGEGLTIPQVKAKVLGTAQRVLGNSRYEQIRTLLLGK